MYQMKNILYSAGGQTENLPTSDRAEYKSQDTQKLTALSWLFLFFCTIQCSTVHRLMS